MKKNEQEIPVVDKNMLEKLIENNKKKINSSSEKNK